MVLACWASSAWPEDDWPVRKFEIFIGKPMTSGAILRDLPGVGTLSVENAIRRFDEYLPLDEELAPPNPMSDEVKREIENYLAQTADMLDQMGFLPPHIEPIHRNAAGEPVYRVYYHDYGAGESPARRRDDQCNQVRPVVEINASKFLRDGRVPPKGYQDLAHEVFHGVQASYPLFRKNCKAGIPGWISEGTAQAVGVDVAAYSRWRINYANRPGDWVWHRWGLRYYDRTLAARKDPGESASEQTRANVLYGASSFWRYLGEYIALSGGAGTVAVKPDYGYLTTLFSSDLGGSPSTAVETAWIHRQLEDYPGIKLGLDRIYPNFVTTLAAYMNTRIPAQSSSPQVALDNWLRAVFPASGCPTLRLNDKHPVVRIPLDVGPVAADCLRLDLAFSFLTDIEISVSGPSKQALKALSVGTENGQVVAQPILIGRDGAWRASFIFNVRPGSDPAVFIIANVADDPAGTAALSAEVQVAATHSVNSIGPVGPMPPPRRPRAGGEAVTMQSQQARVGEQIEEGLHMLNPNMAHGNTVARQPDQPPCADAFQVLPCGPQTSISLSMVPGLFGSTMQSTGRGGAFGQFASMLSGVAAGGLTEVAGQAEEAAKYAASVDGTDVNITIPLIDYGFTGSFNNANLSVSARGGETYQAIGPGDIQPGPGYQFPLSGQVTIEEYTPTILRGSFSGQLVNVDRVDLEGAGDDITLPVHETIEGRFQIVAAWAGDGRFTVEPAENAAESVVKDLQEMLPGLDPGAAAAIQPAADGQGGPAGPGSGGGSGSGGVIEPRCDCSCNAALDPLPGCQEICAGTYAACAGLVATAAMLPTWQSMVKTVEQDAGDPFLRTLPNACDLLDAAAVAATLGAAEVRPSGMREHLAQITSQCAYSDPKARGKQAALNMMFHSLDMFDSRGNPVEELQMKVRGFRFDQPLPEPIEGIGSIAFALHDGDITSLVVLTGVYGTALDSDDFDTELMATWSLTDTDRAPEDRLAALLALARPQVEHLQTLAVTTHEGDGGT